jgi:phosphate transport system substrate-binding protein
VEYTAEESALRAAAAEFRDERPAPPPAAPAARPAADPAAGPAAGPGILSGPPLESRPKVDWPFQVDFSNIQASEEFLRDDRFSDETESSRRPAPAIRTFDATEHASWTEDDGGAQAGTGERAKAGIPENGAALNGKARNDGAETGAPEPPAQAQVESPAPKKVEPGVENTAQAPMFRSFSEPSRNRVPLAILVIVIVMALVMAFGAFAVSKKWLVMPGLSSSESVVAPRTILRLAGSNLIGDNLMPALAAAYLETQGATNVHTIAGSEPNEKIVMGILPGTTAPSAIAIDEGSSAKAFSCLAENVCDVGMAARRISPAEEGTLKTLGGTIPPENVHVLGLNGIAVLVSPSNPLRELSEDKIAKMLTGETTSWPSTGSSERRIKVYALDDKLGSQDTASSLLLGGKHLAPGAERLDTNEAVSDAIASDPNGIGVVGLPFIRNARALAVSAQDTQALLPTRLTIATEEYVFTQHLYLYEHESGANTFIKPFIEFVLAEHGQGLVGSNGFLAQVAAIEEATAPQNAPQEMRKFTAHARRLNLNFRFPENLDEPGADVQTDLDRIASTIADLHIPAEKLMLFGFSDNGASAKENLARSLAGARLLEAELVSRGLSPKVVKGYGPVLPVAPNNTEEGRRHNRRVEIWVKE